MTESILPEENLLDSLEEMLVGGDFDTTTPESSEKVILNVPELAKFSRLALAQTKLSSNKVQSLVRIFKTGGTLWIQSHGADAVTMQIQSPFKEDFDIYLDINYFVDLLRLSGKYLIIVPLEEGRWAFELINNKIEIPLISVTEDVINSFNSELNFPSFSKQLDINSQVVLSLFKSATREIDKALVNLSTHALIKTISTTCKFPSLDESKFGLMTLHFDYLSKIKFKPDTPVLFHIKDDDIYMRCVNLTVRSKLVNFELLTQIDTTIPSITPNTEFSIPIDTSLNIMRLISVFKDYADVFKISLDKDNSEVTFSLLQTINNKYTDLKFPCQSQISTEFYISKSALSLITLGGFETWKYDSNNKCLLFSQNDFDCYILVK